MSLCTAITQDGGRCKARAIKGSEWCYNHHPDHSEERQRHASKGGKRGGRGRPAKAEHQGLREIKQLLSDLTAGVLTGEVERGTAIAANQLVNTTLRALELERRWKEALELEGRLDAVEEVLKKRDEREAG
jgi:hypothetical protein